LSRRTIVLSVGGTDAGKFLVDKTLEAYRRIAPSVDAELVIVSGPSLRLPDSSDYRNLGFVENLHELVYAADLVISLAGRSTMDESIAYGTPGIFIPIKNHFEQEDGAARLGFRFEDVFRLEDLIAEKLAEKRAARAITGGAEKAASLISSLEN
jgi:UDP-N-acetylglucosamine--N-acetylmuramyl-(pentapeptide) pyrophosphoryl-undecaprenol N-acetylglucosamine transferase